MNVLLVTRERIYYYDSRTRDKNNGTIHREDRWYHGVLEMKEDNPFTEHKEVVSRLREPLKIKTVAITSTDPAKQGHMLECTANVSWGEIDEMDTNMRAMIKVWIEIIEGPVSEGGMGSKYMGVRVK